MTEIKKIDITSAGRVGAVVLGSAGFLIGCVYVVASLVSFLFFFTIPDLHFSAPALPFSFLILIVGTVVLAVIGLVLGMITAYVYNYVSRTAGGLRIELSDELTNKK